MSSPRSRLLHGGPVRLGRLGVVSAFPSGLVQVGLSADRRRRRGRGHPPRQPGGGGRCRETVCDHAVSDALGRSPTQATRRKHWRLIDEAYGRAKEGLLASTVDTWTAPPKSCCAARPSRPRSPTRSPGAYPCSSVPPPPCSTAKGAAVESGQLQLGGSARESPDGRSVVILSDEPDVIHIH